MNAILLKHGQLGDILDYFSMGLMVVDADRVIVGFNRSAELITGLKASEIVGRRCEPLFFERMCGRRCAFLEACAPDGRNAMAAAEITGPPARPGTITRIVAPVFGPDRTPSGCVEVFQDHSVLKDLLERVHHDDRRLKLILDTLDIGILTVDRGGHITLFNHQAETITGFDRGDVLGKSWETIFGRRSGRDTMLFAETMADGESRSNPQGEIRTRETPVIPVRANYMALKNEDGRIVGGLATFSDLSLMYQFNSAIRDRYTLYDMVGKDPAIQRIFEIVPVVAASDVTVLIAGPTGTGKDVLAKVIHHAGDRSGKPLVKVNCAALPGELLESEMFGYVKGAFTGADRDKPGRFQEADHGTIFLDEIGDLPLALQAKLLRVLEDQEFYPLGSRKTTRVDVRIISATNQNLEQLVRERRFREDLYYRLNVMRLELPPLKDRRGDIPLLIAHILKRLSAARNTEAREFSNDAMEVLLNHDYPGNVRELENVIEHALIVCQDPVIQRKHLPLALHAGNAPPPGDGATMLDERGDFSERRAIVAMLQKHNWNRGRTAAALDMDRSTLWRKMKKYHISR